jgi:hypothetical protein
MKSVAIIGMMFLAMGLFAQQSSKEVLQKEKVCAKKCENAQKCDKMVKAPIRQVDARTSSVRTGDGNAIRMREHPETHKANRQHHNRVAPLKKKSAKMDEKM